MRKLLSFFLIVLLLGFPSTGFSAESKSGFFNWGKKTSKEDKAKQEKAKQEKAKQVSRQKIKEARSAEDLVIEGEDESEGGEVDLTVPIDPNTVIRLTRDPNASVVKNPNASLPKNPSVSIPRAPKNPNVSIPKAPKNPNKREY